MVASGIGHLSKEARDLLRLCALLGERIRVEDLIDLTDSPERSVARPLEELLSAGLLRDETEGLEFADPVTRAHVYEEIPPAVRRTEHRRIAGRWISRGESMSRVAAHLLRGTTASDPEAAAWLVEAASDSSLTGQEAASWLNRAFELDPALRRRPDLLDRRARLLVWHGRPREALEFLEGCLPLPVEADAEASAKLIELAFNAAHASGAREAEKRWLQAVRDLEEPQTGDSTPAHVLRRARLDYYVGDARRAAEATERLAGSGRLEAKERADTLNQACWLAVTEGRAAAAVKWSNAMLGTYLPLRLRPLFWRHRAWALADSDDLTPARFALSRGREEAESQNQLLLLADLFAESSLVSLHEGSLDEAWEAAEKSLQLSAEKGFPAQSAAPGVILWIAAHRCPEGDLPPAESAAESRWAQAGEILRLRAIGDEAAAAHAATALAPELLHMTVRDRRWFDQFPIVVRACRTADPDLAQRVSLALHRIGAGGEAPGLRLALAWCDHLTSGSPATARSLADQALASPRLLLAAEALEDAAVGAEPPLAAEWLSEAHERYIAAGADTSARRAALALSRISGRRSARAPRPTTGWDSLTAAELRVARLAATGLTNREIGSQLFVSHRTVGAHLAHIFDKLAIRSRVELAREVALQGPAPERGPYQASSTTS